MGAAHLIGSARAATVPPRETVEHHPGQDFLLLAGALFRTVRQDVLLINGQFADFSPSAVTKFRGQIRWLANSGVAVSLLCHPDELNQHGRAEFLERISREPNVAVRVHALTVHGTFVFDRSTVLLWNERRDRNCLLVRSATLLEPLLRSTDAAWQTGYPLADFLRRRCEADTVKLPQVLKLLGSGCKDEVAARELGVSVRTYRRYVAELMVKLDAGSRFQAGARAAALGLLS